MNIRTKLFAAGAAAALCGLANAQVVPYSINYHTPNFGFLGGLGFISGDALFGGLSGDGHYAHPGDNIKICYGVDSTTGGRNQDGSSDITYFQLVFSFPLTNSVQDVDQGLTSFHANSSNSLDGDACFSPFFAQGNDTVTGNPIVINPTTSFAFNPGYLATPGTPFPTFWFIYWNFIGSALPTPVTAGLEPAGIGPTVDALLTNLIFEVQGPTNFGPSANQYYLAGTSEVVGLGTGTTGTGGVTNGNARQGQGLFGTLADLSGAVMHNRVEALDAAGTTFSLTTGLVVSNIGDSQFFNSLTTQTPVLWAANDGNTGAGGADLRISALPVSKLQWRIQDCQAGGEGSTLGGGAASAIDNPALALNLGYVIYSGKRANGMLQRPTGWVSTPSGAFPGILFFNTDRQGPQRLPINIPLIKVPNAVKLGTNYTPAYDPDADADVTTLFEDGVGIGIGGTSNMAASVSITQTAKPLLAGKQIGSTGATLQYNFLANTFGIQEFTSHMTISLQ